MTRLAVIAFASIILSACASATKTTTSPDSSQDMAENHRQSSSASETAMAIPIDVLASDLNEKLDVMQQQSVYFDFNEYVVKPEYQAIIKQMADLMSAHEQILVTLEGNTDERGSGEYNLSLGSKRAYAVRKSLELMGAPSSRIETLSLGEEKPRLNCHEEQCWLKNRRTDFVIKLGP